MNDFFMKKHKYNPKITLNAGSFNFFYKIGDICPQISESQKSRIVQM